MNMNRKTTTLGYAVFTASVLIALGLGFISYRLAFAEYTFARALAAAAQNRGNDTYQLQIKALKLNPFDVRFRLTYAQTNLAIANNIAQREEITETDRQTIQQLVSQAIAEGKNAVAINRLNAGSWEILAVIYRNLLNIANGADQWAVSTYQQSIALNPSDPQLRLNYGQLLYALNQYEPAQRQFEIAVNLKPDFTNARYNLAVALRAQDKLAAAKLQFEEALRLVEAKTQDYETIQNELAAINKIIDEQALKEEQKVPTLQTESELTSPEEATASAQLEPPLELDEKKASPDLTPGAAIKESTQSTAP